MKQPPRPAVPAPAQAPAQAPSWLPWAVLLARLAAGGVLFAAGALKASAPPEEFAVVIEGYQLVSPEASLTLATVVPWCEMFAGVALLTGYLTRAAAGASGALFMGFLGALVSVLARGIELTNCGCFGPGFHPSPSQTLGMDLVLLACCAAAWRWGDRSPGLDSWVLKAPH